MAATATFTTRQRLESGGGGPGVALLCIATHEAEHLADRKATETDAETDARDDDENCCEALHAPAASQCACPVFEIKLRRFLKTGPAKPDKNLTRITKLITDVWLDL